MIWQVFDVVLEQLNWNYWGSVFFFWGGFLLFESWQRITALGRGRLILWRTHVMDFGEDFC